MYLILAIFVSVLVNITASCDSERIYFGSINDTHPDHVDSNGIYIKQSDGHDGHPLYKHESRDSYIYHVSGTLLSSSFWVVGATPGSLSVSISVQTRARTPDKTRQSWMIWNGNLWLPQRGLRAECVDEAFVTCTTGKVRLHGMSPWNKHQRNLTGLYHKLERTHEQRPVYRHIHHADIDYLYYVRGLWMVGPEIGRVTAGLFVTDYAWRPEYIIESWIVFNGDRFQRDSRLRVTCSDDDVDPFMAPDSEDTETDNTNIINIEEGSLPQGDIADLPFCNDSFCLNGGTCIKNEEGTQMCACMEGYEGLQCGRVSSCGDPPVVANAHSISQTGHRQHDMVFYACAEDYHMIGPDSAVVCGDTGLWSSPPECVHWLDYLNPGISPASLMPPTRRHSVPRHRRRFHSRRNKRSLSDLLKPSF